jgi:8-oxo-dGTP pyrophosphatase MutT (NUDIX family)
MHQNPWTRRSRRVAYENPWIIVQHDEVVRPDGQPGIYGVVHYKNRAIGIIARDEQKRIVLVGQYRYPLDLYSWEIPEGGGPLAEDPLGAAQRELREETGLSAQRWSVLGKAHLSNSVSDEEAIYYLAEGLSQGQAEPEGTEQLALRWVDFAQALRMVHAGEITDALSVIALLRLCAADAAGGVP